MPKIKPYDKLLPHHELGEAELTIDGTLYDVSKQSYQDMATIYDAEIRIAENAVLCSSDVGSWKWNHDRQRWERR